MNQKLNKQETNNNTNTYKYIQMQRERESFAAGPVLPEESGAGGASFWSALAADGQARSTAGRVEGSVVATN